MTESWLTLLHNFPFSSSLFRVFFTCDDTSKIIEYSTKDAKTNKKQQMRYTSIFLT